MWECLFMAHRVAMHRLDNTQLGSIAVAEDKARMCSFTAGHGRHLRTLLLAAELDCACSGYEEQV